MLRPDYDEKQERTNYNWEREDLKSRKSILFNTNSPAERSLSCFLLQGRTQDRKIRLIFL